MPLNLNGYPFDNTAEAATNRINPEVIAITDAGSRLFVPSAGFFFGKNFRIVDQLGVALQPGTEFKLLNLEKDATIATGREVYSVVQVIKTSVTQVTLDYQCVGGTYSDTANSIRQLLASLPANSLNAVYWGQILNRPVQFPPAAHMHHAADWYGLGEVVTLLDEIRQAILVGDTAQFQAIYQYITEMLESGTADFLRDNVATLQEVYDGLDDIKFCTPAKLRYAINSTFASSVPEQDQIDIDTTNVFFVQKELLFVPGGQPETALIHTYTFPNPDEQTFSASVPRAQVAFTASGQNMYSRRHNGDSNNWSAWVSLVQNDTLVNHDSQYLKNDDYLGRYLFKRQMIFEQLVSSHIGGVTQHTLETDVYVSSFSVAQTDQLSRAYSQNQKSVDGVVFPPIDDSILLSFDCLVSIRSYTSQGDSNWGSPSVKLVFVDELNAPIEEINLITERRGAFGGNGEVRSADIRAHSNKFMRFNNLIDNELRYKLVFSVESNDGGNGSADDRQIVLIDNITVACEY